MPASQSSCRSANSVADAISAALRGQGEPWLPGLASALAERSLGWTTFDEGRAYGTARWLAADPTGVRNVVGETAIAGQAALVEILPTKLALPFRHLHPLTVVQPEDLELIRIATALVEEVPDLAASVGSVVRALHALRAEEGYDVSHSEPTIPFSIFVSVPRTVETDPAIRLAESIVHEAMHLQLTLVEELLPLVRGDGEGYSPWQGRPRPVRGLLHGLYVFSVILRFMDLVAVARPDLAGKAQRRRIEIGEEVAILEDFGEYLTEAGKAVRAMCLRVTERRRGL